MDTSQSLRNFLPMLGTIKAGFPTFVEEENDLISLEEYLTDNVQSSFMMKIKNDELTTLGILRGDLAVIERRINVRPNEIVLVMMDGHHQFLRANINQGRTHLRYISTNLFPQNPVQIIGIIKGIIRKY